MAPPAGGLVTEVSPDRDELLGHITATADYGALAGCELWHGGRVTMNRYSRQGLLAPRELASAFIEPVQARRGGSSRLFDGTKLSSSRTIERATSEPTKLGSTRGRPMPSIRKPQPSLATKKQPAQQRARLGDAELPDGPHISGPHSQMYEAWFGMIDPPRETIPVIRFAVIGM